MFLTYNPENRGLRWKSAFAVFWMIFMLYVMKGPFDGFGTQSEPPGSLDTTTTSAAAPEELPSTTSSVVIPEASPVSEAGGDEEYVAICAAVKDQSLDLREWFIHHYHHLGIRRFYIMDDGSNPPLSDFKDYGIPAEHITFRYFDRSEHIAPDMQDRIYNICAETYRQNHTWMAFIDADEYLEMTGGETLTAMMKGLETDKHIGALGVSWKTHTSNGQLTRPPSCRKAFTDCIGESGPGGDDQNFKSIVRLVNHAGHHKVHTAYLNGETVTVGEHNDTIIGFFRLPSTKDRIALHHYALKSYEEFEQKLNRSNAMDDPKSWDFWDRVEKAGGFACDSMAQYEP